ncbi:MAG: hypothetical protein ABGX83_05410 [Nitrospira sp.]
MKDLIEYIDKRILDIRVKGYADPDNWPKAVSDRARGRLSELLDLKTILTQTSVTFR